MIDRSSDQYLLDRQSKKLVEKYVEKTIQEVVKTCERKARTKGYKKKHINCNLAHEACEELLITPNSFSPSSLVTGLKEETKRRENYESIPTSPEVA